MRIASRWLALGCVSALLGLGPAPFAGAHGGQFVPPPPPSTPGRATPRDTPRANTPTHVNPGMGGPVVTPGGGFLKPSRVGRRTKPFTPTYETSWRLWWDLNRLPYLPRRPSALAAAVVTPAPAPGEEPRAKWERKRRTLARDVVAPFLLELIDPSKGREKDDVIASACIALGKVSVAGSRKTTDALLSRLLDESAPEIVRESAALALGLLRRSNADIAWAAGDLDYVRGRLLMVWDRFVDGRRLKVPARTRQFALFALGLLGDQAFTADPTSRDGQLICTLLWERFTKGLYRSGAEWISLLTALGLQPPAGPLDPIKLGVEKTAAREQTGNHKISPGQAAHALTATARLSGARTLPLLLKQVSQPRREGEHPGPRLAAAVALGDLAGRLGGSERLLAARVLVRSLGQSQELLVAGLLNVALGRLVAVDLADGSSRVLEATQVRDLLFERASRGPFYVRGFGVLALSLAARGVGGDGDKAALGFRTRVAELLPTVLRNSRLEPDLRGAAAIGLGLLRVRPAVRDLVPLVNKAAADPDLRGYAALALGMIGIRSPEALKALSTVAVEEAHEGLKAHAALALSLLGSPETAGRLIEALGRGGRTSHLAGLALALGHLGDLEAVEPLVALARRRELPELVRAMAIVAVGRLVDPEEWPSLDRLIRGLPYPVRTPAMEEAITIL